MGIWLAMAAVLFGVGGLGVLAASTQPIPEGVGLSLASMAIATIIVLVCLVDWVVGVLI